MKRPLSQEEIKQKQANMQSDAIEMADFSQGVTTMGVGTLDSLDSGIQYSFGDLGDLGQLDLFTEEDLREKYPALKQAWGHYQNVLEMCKSKETEDA